jgi:molybdopterin-guanine dinucleotide biosynthesis protein A
MGKYAELTDKSLLPINGKAIISHIINQYQLSTTHFVVALRRLALKSDIL